MPTVDRPTARVAVGSALAHPVGSDAGGATGINCVGPLSSPAIALEAHQHGLTVGHGLVHVEFQIADFAGRARNVDPCVVEEVLRVHVVGEGDAIAFSAVAAERGVELPGTAILAGRADDAHAACGPSSSAAIVLSLPTAEGFDGAHGVRI